MIFYVTKLLVRVEKLQSLTDEENVCNITTRLFKHRKSNALHLFLKASEVVFMQDLLRHPELLEDALKKSGMYPEVGELFVRTIHR